MNPRQTAPQCQNSSKLQGRSRICPSAVLFVESRMSTDALANALANALAALEGSMQLWVQTAVDIAVDIASGNSKQSNSPDLFTMCEKLGCGRHDIKSRT